MRTILVTGIGRGLGLELARQFLRRGEQVIGTVRDAKAADAAERALGAGRQLQILQLDVRDEHAIQAAAAQVDRSVDVLINNAGVIGPQRQSTLDMDFEGFLETLDVNVLGPLRITQAFLPHLRRSTNPKVVTISSRMGSLSYAKSDRIAYRASKAAVNKVVQGLATDLAAEGIVVVSVHPEWVRTDMGGADADISSDTSAAGMITLIDRLQASDTGRFFDYRGEPLAF
ncbi:MAG TPA: SDR family oxidoreductase [Microvirga sp.]|jgi:NAD(P)-dependent dehydrogenase (short-subunit alcohol dehydrogenase family)